MAPQRRARAAARPLSARQPAAGGRASPLGGPARSRSSPRSPIRPLCAMFRAWAARFSSYRDGDFSFGLHWRAQRRDRRPGRRAQRARRSAAGAAPRPGAARTAAGHDGAEHAGGDAAGRRPATSSSRQHRGAATAQRRPPDRRPSLGELLRDLASLREAMARGGDGLFTVGSDGRRRGRDLPPGPARFTLNGRAHELLLLRHLTAGAAAAGGADLEEGDPRHQPRAQQLARAGRLARQFRARAAAARQRRSGCPRSSTPSRSARATSSASSRATRVSPSCPRRARAVSLAAASSTALRAAGALPGGWAVAGRACAGRPAQMQQALINLLKNAHESGSRRRTCASRCAAARTCCVIEVRTAAAA